MAAKKQWTLEKCIVDKKDCGFALIRPRANVFDAKVVFHIAVPEAVRWRVSLKKILSRLNQNRCRTVPASLAFRCMLGHWRSNMPPLRFFGRISGEPIYIIASGEPLYLITSDSGAHPITKAELENIQSQMSA